MQQNNLSTLYLLTDSLSPSWLLGGLLGGLLSGLLGGLLGGGLRGDLRGRARRKSHSRSDAKTSSIASTERSTSGLRVDLTKGTHWKEGSCNAGMVPSTFSDIVALRFALGATMARIFPEAIVTTAAVNTLTTIITLLPLGVKFSVSATHS